MDRKQIVNSHNPVLTKRDTPLSLGNGRFAFTADITGLQTLYNEYLDDTPLCTMSQWGLHTRQPDKFAHEDLKPNFYPSNNRMIPIKASKKGQEECYNWLRENPHRFNLMNIAFIWQGNPINEEMLGDIRQELNLWEGILYTEFTLNGRKVWVKSLCAQEMDMLSVSVKSELLTQGLEIAIKFPYGSSDIHGSNWETEDRHKTVICERGNNFIQVLRTLDRDKYFCKLRYSGIELEKTDRHLFKAFPKEQSIEMNIAFAPEYIGNVPNLTVTEELTKNHYQMFWEKGGFIDFTNCRDKRAHELSRRVILSQYLTAIQCSGNYPPQETGLTVNSWYGKAHLEMHYWHSFHFLLFDRPELFERSLWWYEQILDEAKTLANTQGFKGARWPKMPWINGIDSPSPIAPFLIWQQPHPINYVYTLYKVYINRGQEKEAGEILIRYRDIVFEMAEFMASFAYKRDGKYILGPGIIPAQENHSPEITVNPTFELEYWHFGLSCAIEWLELIREPVPDTWRDVRDNLSIPAVTDGLYMAHENCPDTFTKFNFDHPSFLCAFGMLPGRLIDKEAMKKSLLKTLECWNSERLWGWDFPVMAMTAARLGMPELAVDCLLMDSPKNTYTVNGHNSQIPRADLPLYLPGNGGLLTAVACMCAGFTGSEEKMPGIPRDWDVRFENLHAML